MNLPECWEIECVRDGLATAALAALRRPGISGETVAALGAFLQMVERLPEHDENSATSLSFSDDTGEGAGHWEAAFDSEGVELWTGEIFRGPQGTDHETRIVFRVTADGCMAVDDLADWLHNFARMAEDPDCDMIVWAE